MALTIFKKLMSTKSNDALDAAVDGVVRLEKKHADAQAALDAAKADLEGELSEDILEDRDGTHQKALQAVILSEARVAAASRLLTSGREAAKKIINDSSQRLRDRLPELEIEIASVKRGIDLRWLGEVANFCARMGLACHLPTATAPGGIQLPAVYGLTQEDLKQLSAQPKPKPSVDPDQEKLDRLRAELNQAHIIVGSSSEIALLTIADAYRRRK